MRYEIMKSGRFRAVVRDVGAGVRLACLAVLVVGMSAGCASRRVARVEWNTDSGEGRTSFSVDGRELLSYKHIQLPYKPYVERFATPAGVNVLRDAPKDHRHHHGLMFGVGAEGVSFWAEDAEAGRQFTRSSYSTAPHSAGEWQYARSRQRIIWETPADRPLLAEKRTFDVYFGGDLDASLLTWQTELAVHEGHEAEQVRLEGRAYYGLGMRFVESMDTGGQFFNADGAFGVAGTNDVKSDWCAYAGVTEGKPVTVAVFDHPDNPRSPARWFTMDDPFAYLSATAGLHHEEMTLAKGETLVFRYGVALWDGHVDAGRVGELYARWKALPVEQDW
jgi:hypothetical protein